MLTKPTAVIALLLSVTAGRAQVTTVPGTGCALPSTTAVLGSANLGQTITITNPFATQCLLQVAVVIAGPPTSVPWSNCVGSPCVIGVVPTVFALGGLTASLSVTIPNDPLLLGVCFDAQSGCLSPACINMDRAVRICPQ